MIAKTFQGLEEILAGELTTLGANDVQIGRRMVSFTGDPGLNPSTCCVGRACISNVCMS